LLSQKFKGEGGDPSCHVSKQVSVIHALSCILDL